MPGRERPEPSLMHNIGAFFGHIVQAIRENPDADPAPAKPMGGEDGASGDEGGSEGRGEAKADALEVRREVQEARHGEYLLRRTTIDEVIRAPEGDADPAGGTAATNDEDRRGAPRA